VETGAGDGVGASDDAGTASGDPEAGVTIDAVDVESGIDATGAAEVEADVGDDVGAAAVGNVKDLVQVS